MVSVILEVETVEIHIIPIIPAQEAPVGVVIATMTIIEAEVVVHIEDLAEAAEEMDHGLVIHHHPVAIIIVWIAIVDLIGHLKKTQIMNQEIVILVRIIVIKLLELFKYSSEIN